MVENDLLQPVKLNGCESCRGVIYREKDGGLTYLSFVNDRRYGVGRLGFKGSVMEFARACIACPPEMRGSFTDSGSWVPTTEKKYEVLKNLL